MLLIKLTGDGSTRVRLFEGGQSRISCEFDFSEDAAALPRWLELWHALSAQGPPRLAAAEDTTEPAQTAESANLAPVGTALGHAPFRWSGELQENPVASRPRKHRPPIWLVAATAILAALITYLMLRVLAAPRGAGSSGPEAGQVDSGSSHSSGLALRVERQGDDLRLDWNRTAPVLAGATGGMLTIREGNGPERQVMLDRDLLRNGSIMYQPVHGDVFLRIVIFGQDGAHMGESVTTYAQPMSVVGSDHKKESK